MRVGGVYSVPVSGIRPKASTKSHLAMWPAGAMTRNELLPRLGRTEGSAVKELLGDLENGLDGHALIPEAQPSLQARQPLFAVLGDNHAEHRPMAAHERSDAEDVLGCGQLLPASSKYWRICSARRCA